jgi:hypothetical protein
MLKCGGNEDNLRLHTSTIRLLRTGRQGFKDLQHPVTGIWGLWPRLNGIVGTGVGFCCFLTKNVVNCVSMQEELALTCQKIDCSSKILGYPPYNSDSNTRIYCAKTCALLFLCAFVLTGCDLFLNKPETDLGKKIDNAVAWANAERLTVRVDYP